MISKAYITKLKNPLYGFKYNVQIVHSAISGNRKDLYYSGYGKFCKTKKSAMQFLESLDEYIPEVQYIEE